MSTPKRRFRLFPRSLGEVVKQATKPLIDEQGKLYGALLRDWPTIVGAERAAMTRPQRVQFFAREQGATLYIDTTPAMAPELAYETEAILEQCTRYFGRRAITRIVFNPVHGLFMPPELPKPKKPVPVASLPDHLPRELKEIFQRMTKRN